MTCPICFDDMDMIDYNDERESTDTCFKLECGHAFHTRCIVQVLSRTDHKCPACNKHKEPGERLEFEGVLRNLLQEIKCDPRVREARNENREAKIEYLAALKQLNVETRKWIQIRAEELKIHEHKRYYMKTIATILSTAKEVAREKGKKYIGAIMSDERGRNRRYGYSNNITRTTLIGPGHYRYWWKLAHPRFWMRI